SSTPAGYELQRGNGRVRSLDTGGEAACPRTLQKPLQVTQGVDGVPVDPHLEMEVGPEAVARAADVTDHLALRHVLAGRDRVRRLVCVAGRHPAAMIDAGVVAVAAGPGGQHDGPRSGSVDRSAVRN